MNVDFPRWEEGDPNWWISRAERYFRCYRTVDATRVEIAAIHLKGDAIQWFNWFKHTHEGLSWQRLKEGLLDRFGPTNFNNIDGQLAKIRAATVHSYGGDFFHAYPGRTIEPRGTKDKGCSSTSHAEAHCHSTAIQTPALKKLTRDKLHERSTKELCWHYDEPWSHKHHYKKGWLLMIEPAEDEDNETSEEALEPKEEAMEEESQPANYAVHALAGYSNP
ncbi:hypothetical protein B296_00024326 [Ensete ventricosum]|uniref:Retrotransposon gag domain-containing protein n=1 Tax=Ensete ventricosum TaxID=4639 RepID=A0A426XJ72_ENSVE|nr:hypothetical protein B296_00024326 [Ensete ventricosum]